MKRYEVELEIVQKFTATVVVEGDFKDSLDPRIDKLAEEKADLMNHDDWNYEETEFEILNVFEEK